MSRVDLWQSVSDALGEAGFKSALVSVTHLKDLKSSIGDLLRDRILDGGFYAERLAHYGFEIPEALPGAESLLITAVRQPKVRVTFQVSGRRFPVIIPPTYDYGTDHKARRIASSGLHERGYRVEDIVLPAKSLAVHAGLATYGRNNITCMEGWGSFFRLKAFCTDLPCGADSWQEPKMMDQCQECVACVKACPSGAIDRERFVIHAERCVTFLNEKTADFPGWVDPGWHSCLIGCMRCQDVCPLNRDNVDGVIDGPEFSEEETSLILGVSPPASLPARTAQKLKKVYMLDEYEVLPRNLKVLIERGR